jgi:hypothetical protein
VPPVITLRRKQISDWLNYELAQLREEMDALEAEGGDVDKSSSHLVSPTSRRKL